MQEIWKDIKDFPRHEVSNFGNIRVKETKLIISQRLSKDGYRKVNLYDNDGHFTRSTHRLVLEAFKSNPENKPQCNHIDGNKLNNCDNNLEWCSGKENIRHAIRLGLFNPGIEIGKQNLLNYARSERNRGSRSGRKGKRCGRKSSKLTEKDVLRILKLRKYGVRLKIIAKHFGISGAFASEISIGKKWKHIDRSHI